MHNEYNSNTSQMDKFEDTKRVIRSHKSMNDRNIVESGVKHHKPNHNNI